MMRLYTIPWSTNVERIVLALAYKDLAVENVSVDPSDRSPIRQASGQDLVPVLVDDDGTVVFDSPLILEHIERRHPDPPLWPDDPARRAEIDVFIDWFNRVWKRPPNQIVAEMEKSEPDAGLIERLGNEMTRSLDRFEALLSGRDHLFGEELTAADIIAFPFLKYGLVREPEDEHEFHLVLERWLPVDDAHPRLRDWVGRMNELPR